MRYHMQHITQKVTLRHFVVLFVLGTLSSGCGPSPEEVAQGDDPLAALAVAVQSDRYDGPFWWRLNSQQPELYAEAASYCQSEKDAGRLVERPNCIPVLQVREFIYSMSQPRREGRGYTGILEKDASD